MRELGLLGARRGSEVRTTVPDRLRPSPRTWCERQFSPAAPDRLWVADFTYVPSWAGMVYARSSSTRIPAGSWAGAPPPP